MKLFQVDAFTSRLFAGNPTGVVPLVEWLDDDLMQRIAMENNLAETAFFIPQGDDYHIRWFTPRVEVDLCGHATLAAAHVLFHHLGYPGGVVRFNSRSGILKVVREGNHYVLDFPSDEIEPADPPKDLIESMGMEPLYCYRGKTDFLLIYEKQADIERIKPDFQLLGQIDARGVIVSAPGFVPVTTHLFVEGDPYLESDAVFAVKHSLVTEFVEHAPGTAPDGRKVDRPYCTVEYEFRLEPA